MSANNNKSKGLVIGLVALAVGVAIGVAGTEISRQNQSPGKTPDTNQIAVTSIGVPNLFADSNQWDPFQEIQRLQGQMNQSLNEMSKQFKRNETNQMSLPRVGAPDFLVDSNQWNPFQEIQRMQAQMDQSFNDMFEQFRMQPQFNFQPLNSNYSSSINVEDLKDRYVVRAYLPDAKASDVHVTLNDGRTLKVEVNSRQSEKSSQTNSMSQVSEWGQYEQTVQLPTPVKPNQMTVKHDGHDLIITIPKAS